MLEKQHSQLVGGLQEMYQRLRRATLWESEPLDESSGRPLTHDILAALDFLEPNEEEFIEQPRSSSMLEEPGEDVSAESTQEIPQPTPPMFGEPALSARTTTRRSPSVISSPTTSGPHQLPRQFKLQPHEPQRRSKDIVPTMSPQIQLDTLWTTRCTHSTHLKCQ